MTRESVESHKSLANWLADSGDPSSRVAGSSPEKASTFESAGIHPRTLPMSLFCPATTSRHRPRRPWPPPLSGHGQRVGFSTRPQPDPMSSRSPPNPASLCSRIRLTPPLGSPTLPAPVRDPLRDSRPTAFSASSATTGQPSDSSTPTRVANGTCTDRCVRTLVPIAELSPSGFAPISSTSASAQRSGKVLESSAPLRPMAAERAASTSVEDSSDSQPVTRTPDPALAKATFSFLASAFSFSTPKAGSS